MSKKRNGLKVQLENTLEQEINKVSEIIDDPEVKLYSNNGSISEDLEKSHLQIHPQVTDKEDNLTQENLVPETIKEFYQTFNPQSRNGPSNLLFRVDDTLNDIRQLNLSFIDTEEKDYQSSAVQRLNSPSSTLNELFGINLVNYYTIYFSPFLSGSQYTWTPTFCQLENLKNLVENEPGDCVESGELELSNIFSEDFSHSFNISRGILNDDWEEAGVEYVKKIFKKSVNVKDLSRFSEGSYMGEGIINAYLRILEVFHEYQIAKAG